MTATHPLDFLKAERTRLGEEKILLESKRDYQQAVIDDRTADRDKFVEQIAEVDQQIANFARAIERVEGPTTAVDPGPAADPAAGAIAERTNGSAKVEEVDDTIEHNQQLEQQLHVDANVVEPAGGFVQGGGLGKLFGGRPPEE